MDFFLWRTLPERGRVHDAAPVLHPEAFLHAEERPMFRGLRSASTERNQV